MKAGYIVSFLTDGIPTYGTVIWVDGDKASVDYKCPISREYKVEVKVMTDLTKIGSK